MSAYFLKHHQRFLINIRDCKIFRVNNKSAFKNRPKNTGFLDTPFWAKKQGQKAPILEN